ncbi:MULTISPECIES: PepSY-like domain-containing protein [Campylobacter]|uniref:PepSY-like domain-containing protein n=1 Tax=Campylobacter molothri TaxID=1032242 RepID=A0ACC5VZ53_9BACT|nr:PepSY-like domain-containing protein [Campylobacter sp. RM10542]MBZ7930318.1 PepSY-like domain-containing protein [Campylobacter sp. W0067]MBZ7933581.1 PepSY-like domain-containing protein [Campylobacter sp. W0065]MBZ7937381.1 PepSY-like domain-containing protein [Campylobacter sp. RM10538]MBZ7940841.1 PepSY-like domain-containing protein [Campylobacter sp. W0047]MBZ7949288.1 PepSY-like domain-containing protein [Campylobacter sp. RM10534]MBZ7954756.1 PepSY-like domain-containing protein [
MKLFFLIFICIFFTHLNADIIISPDNLPDNIKTFIKKNFNASIGIVQKDRNSYEVYLSNGLELEFESDGTWKEIESKLDPFDFNFLPSNIIDIIKNKFPNIKAREIERKINYYKIKLSNGIKIYIDFNGTILHKGSDY